MYQRALTVKSAIPHPRIMGVIRECGGKMHMHQRTWEDAATDFFEVPSLKIQAAAEPLWPAHAWPMPGHQSCRQGSLVPRGHTGGRTCCVGQWDG